MGRHSSACHYQSDVLGTLQAPQKRDAELVSGSTAPHTLVTGHLPFLWMLKQVQHDALDNGAVQASNFESQACPLPRQLITQFALQHFANWAAGQFIHHNQAVKTLGFAHLGIGCGQHLSGIASGP